MTVASKVPHGQARQILWDALLEAGPMGLSLDTLGYATDLQRKYLGIILEDLERCDHVKTQRVAGTVFFQPTHRQPQAPKTCDRPLKDPTLPSQKIWRSIRMLKRFTYRELWGVSNTQNCPISLRTVENYGGALNSSGYFRRLQAPTTGRAGVYMLIQDTGPLPPQRRTDGLIFDRNLRQFMTKEDA